MELYKLDDANYLIEYYSSKMIGEQIEIDTPVKIAYLSKELYNDNVYRVNAISEKFNGNILKRSIGKVITYLNLPTVEDALSDPNRK